MKRKLLPVLAVLIFRSQQLHKIFMKKTPAAERWVKKKFKKLSKDERLHS